MIIFSFCFYRITGEHQQCAPGIKGASLKKFGNYHINLHLTSTIFPRQIFPVRCIKTDSFHVTYDIILPSPLPEAPLSYNVGVNQHHLYVLLVYVFQPPFFQVNLGQPFILGLRKMEMVVTTAAISRANRHHQQTNTQLLTGQCPSCCPTNSVEALTGKSPLCSICQTHQSTDPC